MKVISKQHDYYDTVNYGGDVIYVRHEQKAITRKMPTDIERIFDLLPSLRNTGGSVICRSSLLGFCGKIYPLITLSYCSNNQWNSYRVVVYNSLDLDRAFWKHRRTLKDLKAEYDKTKKRHAPGYHYTAWRYFRPFRKRLLAELFLESGRKINDQIFFDLDSPIFRIDQKENGECEWIVNPCLKETGFQRIFGPFAAHQEVEMYLGGVLGNKEIDTVGVSDKFLKSQKGFDKWSFKRMPTKKR